MNKDQIIKQLREMAKHPTVTLPRDCEALKSAADLLAQPKQNSEKTAPPEEWGEVSREELIKRELEMVKRIAKAELTLDGLTPTEFALRELYEFQEATGCDTAVEFKTQRKPLLASDIVTMYDENPRSDSEMIAFARAIEAAHGIKEQS